MTHYGLLLLFPIDKQYDYIVEKHFEILFKKKNKNYTTRISRFI